MKEKSVHIEIGHKSIIFAIIFVIAIKFLQSIVGILIALFISLLLAIAIYPLVNNLKKFKIPRAASAAVILVLLLVGIIASFASIIPPVINETTSLIQNLPKLIDQLGVYNIDASLLTNQLSGISSNVLKFAIDIFSITVFLTTIMVITFYLILERDNLDEHLRHFFGDKSDKYREIYIEIETKLGEWVRAMLFLMILIGALTYFGLFLIGVQYAIPLAILAGLLEIIPNIGPTIAAIPAIIVGFAISPIHGFLTLGLSVLIQQLENNFIVPNLMKKTVDLHPVIVITALLIGFQLGGPLLAVLSLPLVLTGKVVLSHLYRNSK